MKRTVVPCAEDDAKAAAHAGLMIAVKPAFSAVSSYKWARTFRPPRLLHSLPLHQASSIQIS